MAIFVSYVNCLDLWSRIMAHSLICHYNILFQIHHMEPDTAVRTKYCKYCKNRIPMLNFDIHTAQCLPPPKPPRVKAPKKEKKNKNQSTTQVNANKPEDSQSEDQFPCRLCGSNQTLAQLDSHPLTCTNRQVKCNYCQEPYPTCLIEDHKTMCPNKPRVIPVHHRVIPVNPQVRIPAQILSSVQNGNNSSAVIRVANVRPVVPVVPVVAANSSQSIPVANRNILPVQQRPQQNNMFISDMPATQANNLPNLFVRSIPPNEQHPRVIHREIPNSVPIYQRPNPFIVRPEIPRQNIPQQIVNPASQEARNVSQRQVFGALPIYNRIRMLHQQNERGGNIRNDPQIERGRMARLEQEDELADHHNRMREHFIQQLAYRQNSISASKGMSQQEIDKIPNKKYLIKKEEESQTCSICCCDFSENNIVKDLPCKHLYHTGCITKWLNISPACPLCKCDLSKLVRKNQVQKNFQEQRIPSFSRLMISMLSRNVFYGGDEEDDESELNQ